MTHDVDVTGAGEDLYTAKAAIEDLINLCSRAIVDTRGWSGERHRKDFIMLMSLIHKFGLAPCVHGHACADPDCPKKRKP